MQASLPVRLAFTFTGVSPFPESTYLFTSKLLYYLLFTVVSGRQASAIGLNLGNTSVQLRTIRLKSLQYNSFWQFSVFDSKSYL